MKSAFIMLILFLLVLMPAGFSQDSLTGELTVEVNRVYPAFSISKNQLKKARTLIDLNKHYQSSWIRDYISVEISISSKGRSRKAKSKNDILTQEQKDLMNKADAGSDITVKVRYIPENNLIHNDEKVIDFTFSIDPESEAEYPGGQLQLNKYLIEKAIDKIPEGSYTNYDLTAVKFTVDGEGQVVDAYLFWSSENEQIDQLLLETIASMPRWKPAAYAKGFKIKQEFVLTAGNMENCGVNLLNIRRD